MAKGDNIQERLINFAVRILNLCNALPDSPAGRHVRGQLLRSGTSPAPNYGEARGAESRKDFVHKLGIALKELNESWVWLQMIVRSQMVSEEQMRGIIRECEELSRIINASKQTAQTNSNSTKNSP